MTLTETPPDAGSPAQPARWTAQWKELYAEVITTGLCTGCAGCVVTCPHDVIGYEHEEGKYIPFHLEEELGLDNCVHGFGSGGGCTTCTRACPRFRAWEPAADMHLFGRVREPDEMAGIWRQLLLTRAADDTQHTKGQDGGFVSAMLIWLMDNDYIDAAMVSGVEDDDAWKAKPVLVHNTRGDARHRRQPLHLLRQPARPRARPRRRASTASPSSGMGCQTSSPPIMWDRKAGKVSKPFLFNIGLLCSKTFDDAIFPELFEAKYGLKKQDMVKMNIKGVFQIWMKDGSYHEINLKECHQWTREGCKHCPDFAAEHADISTGGIGKDNDWTLTIVRTELGEEVINRMIADGTIIARPAQEDEVAMQLLRTLSHRQPPSLAEGRRPGAGHRCAAAEEEGGRARPGGGGQDARPRRPRRRPHRPTDVAAQRRAQPRVVVVVTAVVSAVEPSSGVEPPSGVVVDVLADPSDGHPCRSSMNACIAGFPPPSAVNVALALSAPSRLSWSSDILSMTSSMQSCWACGRSEPPGTVIDWTMSLATALVLGLLVQPIRPKAATAMAATARRVRFTAPGG